LITTFAIPELDYNTQCCVTIGSFDGLHKGHMSILKQLVEEASQKGLKSLVFTFDPHPRTVLSQGAPLQLLSTLEEKKNNLEQLGIDYLVIFPFDLEFSRLSARDFVTTILVKGLHTKKIIIGYDHRFGRNRNADIDDLIEFGKEFNFEVQQIQAKQIDAISISSTKIRNALQEGSISTANSYLGYHYCLSGTVVKGNQLGRTLGYPTANIQVDESLKLIPYQGVYIAKSTIDNEEVYGMMNIGTKPTVDGKVQSIEIHYFNFEQNLYDRSLKIELLHRLRDEQKFETIKQLEEQLQIDKAQSLQWIKQKKA
jgi:riboflavin kinase/FMN adenylyltransferase